MWGYFIFPIIFGGRGWRALRDASKDTSHRLEDIKIKNVITRHERKRVAKVILQ